MFYFFGEFRKFIFIKLGKMLKLVHNRARASFSRAFIFIKVPDSSHVTEHACMRRQICPFSEKRIDLRFIVCYFIFKINGDN